MVVTIKSILPVASIFSTCTRQPMALKMVLMIRRYRSATAHVESDDRVVLSLLFQFHYFQTFEKLLLSLKVGLEGIDKNRLTEAAWAAQVIILLSSVGKLPNDIGLVNDGRNVVFVMF
jgi:hypothetical protein